MTQKDFIKKFKQICQKNSVTAIDTENWTYGVKMCYINYQDDEIVNEFVEIIGFDEDGDFYIDFCDGCTSYEEDLECNREDAWDLLHSAILDDIFELDSTNDGHDFEVGDAVYWNDPAINDYPVEEREEALKRRFVVFKVEGETISISDTYTTVEVYASELEHIS
jgi:hypothetical protein